MSAEWRKIDPGLVVTKGVDSEWQALMPDGAVLVVQRHQVSAIEYRWLWCIQRGEENALIASRLDLDFERATAEAEEVWKNDPAQLRLDALRYRRLRVLGCAPGESVNLDRGTVLRFTNLDAYVDLDMKITPNRGEE